MPRSRLSPDEVDFIMNMKKIKYSNCETLRKRPVLLDSPEARLLLGLLLSEHLE